MLSAFCGIAVCRGPTVAESGEKHAGRLEHLNSYPATT
jgi:hypothetical protein